MVSTLDSESSDPSSNLGGTFLLFFFSLFNLKLHGLNSCLIKNDNGVHGIKSQIEEILKANRKVTGVVFIVKQGLSTKSSY